MVSHNISKLDLLKVLFAIDFIEKTQKMSYNTPKVINLNNVQKDSGKSISILITENTFSKYYG